MSHGEFRLLRLLSDDELLGVLKAGPRISGYDQAAVAGEIIRRIAARITERSSPPSLAAAEVLAIRQHCALRQDEIAAICGVSKRTWRSWETGQHAPPPEAVATLRLCEAAGAGLWESLPADARAALAATMATDFEYTRRMRTTTRGMLTNG